MLSGTVNGKCPKISFSLFRMRFVHLELVAFRCSGFVDIVCSVRHIQPDYFAFRIGCLFCSDDCTRAGILQHKFCPCQGVVVTICLVLQSTVLVGCNIARYECVRPCKHLFAVCFGHSKCRRLRITCGREISSRRCFFRNSIRSVYQPWRPVRIAVTSTRQSCDYGSCAVFDFKNCPLKSLTGICAVDLLYFSMALNRSISQRDSKRRRRSTFNGNFFLPCV